MMADIDIVNNRYSEPCTDACEGQRLLYIIYIVNIVNIVYNRYNEPCTDACAGRGKDYFWCNTIDSWDYCSPKGGFQFS